MNIQNKQPNKAYRSTPPCKVFYTCKYLELVFVLCWCMPNSVSPESIMWKNQGVSQRHNLTYSNHEVEEIQPNINHIGIRVIDSRRTSSLSINRDNAYIELINNKIGNTQCTPNNKVRMKSKASP